MGVQDVLSPWGGGSSGGQGWSLQPLVASPASVSPSTLGPVPLSPRFEPSVGAPLRGGGQGCCLVGLAPGNPLE